MKSFVELAQFYASYHTKKVTRATHLVGVPLIILALMILLGFVKVIIPGLLATNLATLATMAALVFYFRLNWQLALGLTPIMFILLGIASWFNHEGPTALGLWAFVITFVLGWALQLYGHYLEGRKPALMDNFFQALIAPLFLVADLFFMAGFMKELKEQIYGPE